eukprot:Ihof_evm2s304 gene=Ihof_evmTU2s304
MPLSVEEYRVAQRYMIAKKSLEVTSMGDGGVEFVENKPYTEGPGGSGQYTKKIYHIGSRLPSWMQSVLPKTALSVSSLLRKEEENGVYEEAWNSYPYTLTKYKIPLVEKFTLEIETVYKPDNGNAHENIFNLKGSELSNRKIDYVNLLESPYNGKPEEDPHSYQSTATGRGPLIAGWENTHDPIMCAYKVVKIEFKYWGLQSRIENFICDVAIRAMVLSGHIQAWAWQDEWYNKTMDDILLMEEEVALKLGMVIAQQATDHNEEKASLGLLSSNAPTDPSDRRPSLLVVPAIDSDEEEEDRHTHTRKHSMSHSNDVFWDAEDFDDSPMREKSYFLKSFDSIDNSGKLDRSMRPNRSYTPPLSSSMTMPNMKRVSTQHGYSYSCEMDGGPVDRRDSQLPEHLILSIFAPSIFAELDQDDIEGDYRVFTETFQCALAPYIELKDTIHLAPVYVPSVTNRNAKNLLTSVLHRPTDRNTIQLEAMVLVSFCGAEYEETLDKIVVLTNKAYETFMAQHPDFLGHVSIVADRTAGVAVYDALCASGEKLAFKVHQLFTLGCPLGLVLGFRQSLLPKEADKRDDLDSRSGLPSPPCDQMINIFQSADPLACRLEPLFDQRFSLIPPANVLSILSMQEGTGLLSMMDKHSELFPESQSEPNTSDRPSASASLRPRRRPYSDPDVLPLSSSQIGSCRVLNNWWGVLRLDYQLPSPNGLQAMSQIALMYATQGSYLQSKDLMSFILGQLVPAHGVRCIPTRLNNMTEFTPTRPMCRWNRFRTRYIVAGAKQNHRGNDTLVQVGNAQILHAKMTYGMTRTGLAGEDVDIFVLSQPPYGEWILFGTTKTSDSGRVSFQIPTSMELEPGVYPVVFLVRGDHSMAVGQIWVVRPKTEAIIFSIDGSFAASTSISGADPKIQARAVDIVREWAMKEYLIVYATSRLAIQQNNVMSFLARHNFPLGSLHFCNFQYELPFLQKAEFLKKLVERTDLVIKAAYGSYKDIVSYRAVGVPAETTFILGRTISTSNIVHLSSGYTQ